MQKKLNNFSENKNLSYAKYIEEITFEQLKKISVVNDYVN